MWELEDLSSLQPAGVASVFCLDLHFSFEGLTREGPCTSSVFLFSAFLLFFMWVFSDRRSRNGPLLQKWMRWKMCARLGLLFDAFGSLDLSSLSSSFPPVLLRGQLLSTLAVPMLAFLLLGLCGPWIYGAICLKHISPRQSYGLSLSFGRRLWQTSYFTGEDDDSMIKG